MGRETTALPATFGNPEVDQTAGAHTRSLALTFYSPQTAASVLVEIRDIILTDDAQMDFDILYDAGAVGSNNERYTGTVTVTSLDIAPVAVGETRVQTQSYPLVAGSLDIAPT